MGCNQESIVSDQGEIDQLRKDLVLAHSRAQYYENLHERNVQQRERIQREHDAGIRRLKSKHEEQIEALNSEIQDLKAKLKLRERQLFGKKSEKKNSPFQKEAKNKNKRGQVHGKKSPPKREYSHLPIVVETQDIPESERTCPCCNTPYIDMNSTEDSEVIEVEVKAHIRRIKRKKYKKGCRCFSQPVILTADQIPKVLPKSQLGHTVWVDLLMQKYWHGHPLNRALQELWSHGLSFPSGTIVGGFLLLSPLLKVVYEKIHEKSLNDDRWHADETGWKVFETISGKANNRWFLWVFKSNSTVIYLIDPSRSAKIIKGFFGKDSKGILSCDRYKAYFCFVNESGERFLIAYCWVHVRRDFLGLAKDQPQYESWAMDWVDEIGFLYYLNNLRIKEEKESNEFKKYHEQLKEGLERFREKIDIQIQDEKIPKACRKLLESLKRHWHGLITFLDHPEIPMDNNEAERKIRPAAVARKNYYGSGSTESAEFTAIMFSIIQTLLLWEVNPQKWFLDFFNAMGAQKVRDVESWLPWNLPIEKRVNYTLQKRQPSTGPPSS